METAIRAARFKLRWRKKQQTSALSEDIFLGDPGWNRHSRRFFADCCYVHIDQPRVSFAFQHLSARLIHTIVE